MYYNFNYYVSYFKFICIVILITMCHILNYYVL
jgi:hypothetical protein